MKNPTFPLRPARATVEVEHHTKLDVPRVFWDDHCGRIWFPGRELSRTRNRVQVELSTAQLRELLSDAEFYAGETTANIGAGNFGVIRSAAATVRTIRRRRKE